MGYSKFTEDLERTRSDNVFGTRLDIPPAVPEAQLCCPFCDFKTTDLGELENHRLRAHGNAAFFLEYENRLVPERALFGFSRISLKVRCPGLPRGVEVSWKSRSASTEEVCYKDGQYLAITPDPDDVVHLLLRIGNSRREHMLCFKEHPTKVETTATLMETVRLANSSIQDFQREEIRCLEEKLLAEPGLRLQEQKHRIGIARFYHGLWLEQSRKPEYRGHLEEAFNVLRVFEEPLALLISSYFLFRTNSFDAISRDLPFPGLRKAAAFFRDEEKQVILEAPLHTDPERSDLVQFEITIAEADKAVFNAVSFLEAQEFEKALEECAKGREHLSQGDVCTLGRLLFVSCRALRSLGRSSEALALEKHLLGAGSGCPRPEAREFTKYPKL